MLGICAFHNYCDIYHSQRYTFQNPINEPLMKFLLRAKHWQLFIILFGIPFLAQFVFIGSVISHIESEGSFTTFPIVFPIVMVVWTGIFFGWLYVTGINLYKKLPSTVTMSLKLFKIFIAIPVIYILFICVFVFGFFDSSVLNGATPGAGIFLFIVPIHLFSMFCIFYCLYFVSKCLKAVEWQRPVTFSDYAGEFFLIWFFFIGVWLIQPRINKLFNEGIQSNT